MTPDDEMLAAELALGLLDGAERAAALERLLAEPAFAAEFAWWRGRLGAASLDAAAVDAPDGLFARIEGRLAEEPFRANWRRWPGHVLSAAAGALAAALVAIVLVPEPRVVRVPVATAAPAPLLAVLTPSEGESRAPVAAVYDAATRTLRFSATIVVPEDRAAELWRIGSDQVPRPLGLLAPGARTIVSSGAGGSLRPQDTIAISIEPAGGSDTGKPTGPVIAAGSLVST